MASGVSSARPCSAGALLHTLQQHVAGGFEGHHVVERSVEVGEHLVER